MVDFSQKEKFDIAKIFVGRVEELDDLVGYWQFCLAPGENKAYVLLNAPGVGKSALLKKFGEELHNQKQGLFIKYDATLEYDDIIQFKNSLMTAIYDEFSGNMEYVQNFIMKKYGKNEIKEVEFKSVKKKIFLYKSEEDKISNGRISEILRDLSKLIPVFLMIDEIQELQKITFINKTGEEETYLHDLTRILKAFLNSKILIILSGTRYHILSQIGYNIGSPLRGKVHSFVLSNLSIIEIEEFVQAFRERLEKSPLKEKYKDILQFIPNYHQFLLAFSGGHGRTIERITTQFMGSRKQMKNDPGKYLDYAKFTKYFLNKYILQFQTSAITTGIEETLKNFATDKRFGLVKSWIISKAHAGLYLGPIPPALVKADKIIYSLVNVGLIFKNGDEDFYLTSYFHLRVFFEYYDSEHQLFISQVLNNRFFTQMCGGPRGFGFTFEDILLSSFFLLKEAEKIQNLPFDPTNLAKIEKYSKPINWGTFPIKSGVMYSGPSQPGVDAFLLQGDKLVLMQITTQRDTKWEKVQALLSVIKELTVLKKNMHIIGCFISLYDVYNAPSKMPDEFIYLAGNALQDVLGEALYTHLLEVKDSLV